MTSTMLTKFTHLYTPHARRVWGSPLCPTRAPVRAWRQDVRGRGGNCNALKLFVVRVVIQRPTALCRWLIFLLRG